MVIIPYIRAPVLFIRTSMMFEYQATAVPPTPQTRWRARATVLEAIAATIMKFATARPCCMNTIGRQPPQRRHWLKSCCLKL